MSRDTTMVRLAAGAWITMALLLALSSRPVAAHLCPGDCNADDRTTAEEVRQVVDVIFDALLVSDCFAADGDFNGVVTAADVAAAVLSAVDPEGHCVPSSTPSPVATSATHTPTPTATDTRQSTATPTRTPAPTFTNVPSPTRTPTTTPEPSVTVTPASTWIPLAPLAEGARQEVGIAAIGETVYVIGGFDGVGRVEAYAIASNTWTTVASLPAPRNHVGAGTAAGLVYAIGGFVGTGFTPARDVYRYDPDVDRWDPVAALPTARGALAVAVRDGNLHAVGGSGPGGSVTRHDVYDPNTNEWTELAPLPSARNHLAAATIDGHVYVVGGRGGPNTSELDRYNLSTNSWEVLEPMPTARSGLAAVALNGRLVVMGGEVNPAHRLGVFPQVEMYDPATNEWLSLDPMAEPRHGIGAVTVGSSIYVPGGATRAGFGATDRNDALLVSW